MRTLKEKFTAGVLAAVTAVTPIAEYIPAYAAEDIEIEEISIQESEDTQTDISISGEMDTEVSESENIQDDISINENEKAVQRLLLVQANSAGGQIIIDEGEEDETTIRICDIEGVSTACTYNKNGDEVSEEVLTEESGYTYPFYSESDGAAIVKAIADDGYQIKTFSVDGEETGFSEPVSEFSYPIFLEGTSVMQVEFQEENDGIVMEEETEIAIDDIINMEETEAEISVESEAEPGEQDDDLSVSIQNESETEAVTESQTEANDDMELELIEQEALPEQDMQMTIDKETEHFTEISENINILEASKFETMRLVVLSSNKDTIIDQEHLVGEYDNIYLLQYASPEQAMTAYLYYQTYADAVEPDMVIATAETLDNMEVPDEVLDEMSEMTSEENPLTALAEEQESVKASRKNGVIALIDTGTASGNNIIDRVSLIDDVLAGGMHGEDMAKCIVSQNPEAKILSIRALGNDGWGSYSSVIAGIEYAINSNVEYINLSMSSEKTLMTSVIEQEIQKAIDSGITVVGAAGNNGQDAAGYIPGGMDDVYSIGSANPDGTRNRDSNYGDTVDFYAVAASTSEAAATFTGYISANGIEAAVNDETNTIFKTAEEPEYDNSDIDVWEDDPNEEKTESTLFDPYIENYVKENVDKEYVGEGDLSLVNLMDVKVLLAAKEELNENETIDSLSGDDEMRFLSQQVGFVPVYQLNEESDYVVAFADVMHNDKRAEAIDYTVARNDISGESYDGCIYQKETGLLYIPKNLFYGEDGTYYYEYLQAQILYSLSNYNVNSEWNSSVITTTENSDGDAEVSVEGDNIIMQGMTVQVGKYMDVNSMLVSVNGFPIQGNLYAYDAESGLMTVGFSSAVVQSIYVQAEKDENAPEVEPGMQAAYGAPKPGAGGNQSYTSAEMSAIADTIAKADFDRIVAGFKESTTASICYPNGTGNLTGMNVGGTVVFAYRGVSANSETAWVNFVNYILKGTETGKPTAVYSTPSGAIYPFALKVNSIDSDYIDFSAFSKNLNLVLECCHVNAAANTDLKASNWKSGAVAYRVVTVNKTASKPYAVLAVYTQKIYTQHGIGTFKVYITPDEQPGTLKLTKKLLHKDFVTKVPHIKIDTEFTIYSDKACKKKVKTVPIEAEAGETVKTVYVDGLDAGKYYMKETKRCPGCLTNKNLYSFVIEEGKTQKTIYNETLGQSQTYAGNTAGKFYLTIKKEDEKTNEPLAEAIFKVVYSEEKKGTAGYKELYTWYFESKETGLVKYHPNYLVEEYKGKKSDELLSWKKGKYGLPTGYVYITEVEAPPGYKISDTSTKEIHMVLQKDDDGAYTTEVYSLPPVTFDDEPEESGVLLTKYISNADFSNSTSTIAINTEFCIYSDKNCTKKVGDPITLKASWTQNTKSVYISLDPGTYYLKETKKCLGCVVNQDTYSFVVKKGEKTTTFKNLRTEAEVKKIPNVPGRYTGDLVLKRDAITKQPLKDAVFEITYAVAKREMGKSTDLFTWYLKSDKDGKVQYDEKHYLATFTDDDGKTYESDEPLKLSDGTWALPVGYLYIREVKAPEGYEIDNPETKTLRLQLAKDEDTGLYLDYKIKASPLVFEEGSGVYIKKSSNRQYESLTMLNGKDNPLYADMSGAKYAVFNEDGTPYKDKDTGKQVVLTTNEDGESETILMDEGKYYVKEIEAPKNYKLNKDKVNFKVVKNKATAIKVYDEPVGDIDEFGIVKVDPETKTGASGQQNMDGAEFELRYWAQENGAHEGNPDCVWKYKTITKKFRENSYGYFQIDDPKYFADDNQSFLYEDENGNGWFPVGTYQLIETKAPTSGFILPSSGVSMFGTLTQKATGSELASFNWNYPDYFIPSTSSTLGYTIPNVPTDSYIALNEPGAIKRGVSIQKVDKKTGLPQAQGDASLEGIQFAIYNKSENPVTVLGTTFTSGAEITTLRQYLVTDNKGRAKTPVDALPVGSYAVKEIASNGSYALTDGKEHPFQITNTDTVLENGTKVAHASAQNECVLVCTAEDEVARGGISVPKIDHTLQKGVAQGNATLKGAEFTIVNASSQNVEFNGTIAKPDESLKTKYTSGTISYQDVVNAINNGCKITTISTDESGLAKTAVDALPYGTYFVIETKAPNGYKLNNTWIGYVAISAAGNNKLTSTTTVEEDIISGGLEVQKQDVMLASAAAHGNATMAYAEFAIVNASHNAVKNKDGQLIQPAALSGTAIVYTQVKAAVDAGHVVQVLTTDAAGHATTEADDLPYGEYYVIETSAPEGYAINETWVGYVNVTEDRKIYQPTAISGGKSTVDEQIYRGGIEVQKYDLMLDRNADHGDANLAGAEFTIVNASRAAAKNKAGQTIPAAALTDSSTYQDILNAAATSTMQKITTDVNGHAATGNQDLPFGTYYVIETKAPNAYDVNTDWIGRVTIREDQRIYSFTETPDGEFADTVVLNGQNRDGRIRDQIWRGGLKVQKFDYMRDNNESHGDMNLAGFQFSIINASKSVVKNRDGQEIATSGITGNASYETVANALANNTVQVVTTDTNGVASTGQYDLPYGTYYVIETYAPDGYFLNTKWVGKIEVKEKGTIYTPTVVADSEHHDMNHTYLGEVYDGDAYATRDQIWRAGVKIQKFDYMRDNNEPHGDTDLDGFEFKIVNASNAVIRNKDDVDIPTSGIGSDVTYDKVAKAIEDGCMVQKLVTDRNGQAQTGDHDLPYGTYYIIETKAPDSYRLNTTWVGKVVVREDGKMYTPDAAVASDHHDMNHEYLGKVYDGDAYATRDQIWRGGLKVQKFDYMRDNDEPHGDKTLEGFQFSIINSSKAVIRNKDDVDIPTAKVSGNITYSKLKSLADAGYTAQVITTNKNGDAVTGKYDLPYGTYYVIETYAPEGYDINNQWVGYFEVREDGKVYTPTVLVDSDHHDMNHEYLGKVYDEDEYATRDQIWRSGIEIQKADKEMKQAVTQGESTLSGAEFVIINASDAVVRNKDDVDIATAKNLLSDKVGYQELKTLAGEDSEYVVQRLVTDEKGYCKTGKHDLPYGTYYVIETKASYGYWLDDKFIGKVVVRDDGLMLTLNGEEHGASGNSIFTDLSDTSSDQKATVDQQIRRRDLRFMKVDIDGEYLSYIPFLISAIKVNEDGTETVIEEHVIVSNEYGVVDTRSTYLDANTEGYVETENRLHSYNTNGFDKYVKNGVVTAEGEKILSDAEVGKSDVAKWGIWFQGNSTDAEKTAINDKFGSLYSCYYRITELQCNKNKEKDHNLVNSGRLYIYNDSKELTEVINTNDLMYVYHPLVNTEIYAKSEALDEESGSKTLPARTAVEITDTVDYTHLSADHKYRLETQFVDMTDGQKILKIVGTKDADAVLTEDNAWVTKEFMPDKKSTTNSTYCTVGISATLNTKELNGHTIMAVDYLYEYIDVADNDNVPGDWVLVSIHPKRQGDGTYVMDEDQCVYVPDLKTNAYDSITGDREGAKDKNDSIFDKVEYSGLSTNETYTIRMTIVDKETGEYLVTDEAGKPQFSGIDSKTGLIYKSSKKEKTPYSGSTKMEEFKVDSSVFDKDKTAVVIESLYRADGETGETIGEPILVHDSILDEDQTIRWPDVCTSAADKETTDDVGTSEKDAVVYDEVKLSNILFDDNDHEDGSGYTYTVTGHLVYQNSFKDTDGKTHKAGEKVETLEGTQDTVTITYENGALTCRYPDGTKAKAEITKLGYGMNRAKYINGDMVDNSYLEDTNTVICDLTVEMIYHVDSSKLEGGSVVAYEYLKHDSSNENETVIDKHEDIDDEDQTVHYPKVQTSAASTLTGDDVGGIEKEAVIIDTVTLTNLVPGRDYTITGVLMNQETGKELIVNGNTVTKTVFIHVTEEGEIETGNGETSSVTSYNKKLHEVCGVINIPFEFDASSLEGKTCVVFETLTHNAVDVAVHHDILDESQSVHFPKIRTNANDIQTGDKVGTVTNEISTVDTVTYENLVIGRTYTVSGKLVDKATGETMTDADGKEVTASRTFEAGAKENGIEITELDEEHHKVSGTVDITFTYDSSLLEGKTFVAYEDLIHNDKVVTTHSDISDKEQTIHYPKIRTNAIDATVGDEVGFVGETKITDTVRFWNLIPGMDYTIQGVLVDKETGEVLKDADGNVIRSENEFHVNDDGTVDSCCDYPCNCKGNTCTCEDYAVCISKIDLEGNFVDGHAKLPFHVDASELAGKDIVVFEKLFHNGVEVTRHEDLNDLAQTIHFPEIHTEALDVQTGTHAGTVGEREQVTDKVFYSNLVIGKEYTLKGTLMNQATGMPVLNSDGSPVTKKATFVAGEEEEGVCIVENTDENAQHVSGYYVLTFDVDSSQLAGQSVVAFEKLYHNEINVVSHEDIEDESQTVHYPDIRTTAVDESTGDHVGSIFGAFINGVRHLFGEKDADGNGIPDDRQQNIIDTVELDNLVPGLTYVVSGKLYDAGASQEQGENIPLVIDGQEIVQAVTITVSEDGKKITAADGSKTSVTGYDETKHQVDGTVDLTYILDSSKIQGTKIVVFENLYQDVTYNEATMPTDVEDKDIINKHADVYDEGQSVSEVSISTTAVDTQTGDHVGTVANPEADIPTVIHDEVSLAGLVPQMGYEIRGVLVDIGASDFENGKVQYLNADGALTEKKEEAYSTSYRFTAEETEEVHSLNFALATDKVQGRALTVFEEILHNDVIISAHPDMDEEGWNEENFQAQTVYYPTGKTNATDNTTESHTSYAGEGRKITDRVYFENLLEGETYKVEGYLVYQSDFTDADGVEHKAGEIVEGTDIKAVEFKASEDLKVERYTDADPDTYKEVFGIQYIPTGTDPEGNVYFDSIKVTTLPNGQRVISGYVSLVFDVDAEQLAGATTVAFESLKHNGTTIFTHKDLTDEPQMTRFPEIRTNAKTGELDEADIYNADGSFRDIEITDTVTYRNLWTSTDYEVMAEKAKDIYYKDGTAMGHEERLYDVNEKAEYILKGVLMDKATGEPLANAAGEEYVVYSDPFTPENRNGSEDVTFIINAKDFIDEETGETTLENVTLVVFEDLFQAGSREDAGEKSLIAAHHDIEDGAQDIRIPKGRTHAVDTIDYEGKAHEEDKASSHEAYAGEQVSITDTVTYENLHAETEYTISGKLMMVTEYAEDGSVKAYEPAKDADGKEITAEVTFTTPVGKMTNENEAPTDSVSGTVDLVFTFNGTGFAGKTLVAFETCSRNGQDVFTHADINNAPQTIFLPEIGTHAYDLFSGADETLAAGRSVIADKVSYQNLEYGKTYTIHAALHDKETGSLIEGTELEGRFVAGIADQYVLAGGTAVMTEEALRTALANGLNLEFMSIPDEKTGDIMKRTDGEVTVIFDLDTSDMAGRTMVAFEEVSISEKPVADHKDLTDEEQDVKVPEIRTQARIDGEQFVAEGTKAELVDTVTYKNLTPGRSYTLEGVLMDKESGEEAGFTASTEFTPETADGTAEVKFDFDSTGLEGKHLVVFETLSITGTDGQPHVTAEHKDLEDKDQSIVIPRIRTTATDANGRKTVFAGEKATVIDVITYEGLEAGREYTVSGELVDKETGDRTGIQAEAGFIPEQANGETEVRFEFDATELAGKTLVAFEKMATEDGKDVASHEDIEDESQTVYLPKIRTTAVSGEGNKFLVAGEKASVVDTITYENLIPGGKYKVSGELADKETGEMTGIYAEAEFIAEQADGQVEVTFEFDASEMTGKSLVAFETLSDEEGTPVAEHKDLADEDQTVSIPKIGTSATIDHAKSAVVGGTVTVTDEVSYSNLEAGRTYKVSGMLMDKSDGKETGITGSTEFTAETPDGTVEVTFDVDTEKLGACSLVVFETMTTAGEDGKEVIVAVHKDIDDEAQTVTLGEAPQATVTPTPTVTPVPTETPTPLPTEAITPTPGASIKTTPWINTGDTNDVIGIVLLMIASLTLVITRKKKKK